MSSDEDLPIEEISSSDKIDEDIQNILNESKNNQNTRNKSDSNFFSNSNDYISDTPKNNSKEDINKKQKESLFATDSSESNNISDQNEKEDENISNILPTKGDKELTTTNIDKNSDANTNKDFEELGSKILKNTEKEDEYFFSKSLSESENDSSEGDHRVITCKFDEDEPVVLDIVRKSLQQDTIVFDSSDKENDQKNDQENDKNEITQEINENENEIITKNEENDDIIEENKKESDASHDDEKEIKKKPNFLDSILDNFVENITNNENQNNEDENLKNENQNQKDEDENENLKNESEKQKDEDENENKKDEDEDEKTEKDKEKDPFENTFGDDFVVSDFNSSLQQDQLNTSLKNEEIENKEKSSEDKNIEKKEKDKKSKNKDETESEHKERNKKSKNKNENDIETENKEKSKKSKNRDEVESENKEKNKKSKKKEENNDETESENKEKSKKSKKKEESNDETESEDKEKNKKSKSKNETKSEKSKKSEQNDKVKSSEEDSKSKKRENKKKEEVKENNEETKHKKSKNSNDDKKDEDQKNIKKNDKSDSSKSKKTKNEEKEKKSNKKDKSSNANKDESATKTKKEDEKESKIETKNTNIDKTKLKNEKETKQEPSQTKEFLPNTPRQSEDQEFENDDNFDEIGSDEATSSSHSFNEDERPLQLKPLSEIGLFPTAETSSEISKTDNQRSASKISTQTTNHQPKTKYTMDDDLDIPVFSWMKKDKKENTTTQKKNQQPQSQPQIQRKQQPQQQRKASPSKLSQQDQQNQNQNSMFVTQVTSDVKQVDEERRQRFLEDEKRRKRLEAERRRKEEEEKFKRRLEEERIQQYEEQKRLEELEERKRREEEIRVAQFEDENKKKAIKKPVPSSATAYGKKRMTYAMMQFAGVSPTIPVTKQIDLSKYDFEDFDESLAENIPEGLLALLTHGKESIVFRALCGVSIVKYPQNVISRVLMELKHYLDLCVEKGLIAEGSYVQCIIEAIKDERVEKSRVKDNSIEKVTQRLLEAESQFEKRKNNWENQKSIMQVDKQLQNEDLELRYQEEAIKLDEEWNSEKMQQKFNKPSPQLIEMRHNARSLLATHRFEEAAQVAEQIAKREAFETEEAARRMSQAYQAATVRLREKFELERETIDDQFRSKYSALLRAEESNLRPLSQRIEKYKNIKEDAEMAQKRSKSSYGRPKSTRKPVLVTSKHPPIVLDAKLKLPPLSKVGNKAQLRDTKSALADII